VYVVFCTTTDTFGGAELKPGLEPDDLPFVWGNGGRSPQGIAVVGSARISQSSCMLLV
jgi:hypothetical protein